MGEMHMRDIKNWGQRAAADPSLCVGRVRLDKAGGVAGGLVFCVLDGLIPSFIKAEVSPISLGGKLPLPSLTQPLTSPCVTNNRSR